MQANEYIVHGGIDLARGDTLRIENGRGVIVYAWQGELWLTQEADSRDVMLAPGEWFRLDRDGFTLVAAFASSALTLTAAQPLSDETAIDVVRAGTETAQPVGNLRPIQRHGSIARLVQRMRRAVRALGIAERPLPAQG